MGDDWQFEDAVSDSRCYVLPFLRVPALFLPFHKLLNLLNWVIVCDLKPARDVAYDWRVS